MKHFVNPETGHVFAYESDGSQDYLIQPGLIPTAPVRDPADVIRTQIAALEMSITPRRLREAVLTGDKSFIGQVEEQIAALRAQL